MIITAIHTNATRADHEEWKSTIQTALNVKIEDYLQRGFIQNRDNENSIHLSDEEVNKMEVPEYLQISFAYFVQSKDFDPAKELITIGLVREFLKICEIIKPIVFIDEGGGNLPLEAQQHLLTNNIEIVHQAIIHALKTDKDLRDLFRKEIQGDLYREILDVEDNAELSHPIEIPIGTVYSIANPKQEE